MYRVAKEGNDGLREAFLSPRAANYDEAEAGVGTARSAASAGTPARGSIDNDVTFDLRAPRGQPTRSSTLAPWGVQTGESLALAAELNVIDLGETEASVDTAKEAVGWGAVLLRLLDVGLFLGEEVNSTVSLPLCPSWLSLSVPLRLAISCSIPIGFQIGPRGNTFNR